MAVDPYNYAWAMSLTYDEWARSLDWISRKIEAQRQAGVLTDAQVVAIWNRHDALVQAKVDAYNAANPLKPVQVITGVSGSATATVPEDPNDWPLWKKAVGVFGLGSKTIVDSVTGAAQDAAGALAEPANKALNYLVLGGLVLLIINLIKR